MFFDKEIKMSKFKGFFTENVRLFIIVFLITFLITFFVVVEIEKSRKFVEIQGIVCNVEYIAEGSSWNSFDVKKTVITFDDGRIKCFQGISDAVFQKGKINVIVYDNKGIDYVVIK